jgi:ParB-like chromosome segregation protein Spo0J
VSAIAPLPDRRPPEEIRIELIDGFDTNPQEQDGATFAALVESMRTEGQTETVELSGPNDNGRYMTISGHHKIKAAKIVGYETVWAFVRPPMDRDEIGVRVVHRNQVRGRVNPFVFTRLFNDLAKRIDPAELRARMGITSDKAWQQLYKDIRKQLPPEIAKKLDETKKEVSDVETLALVIKKIFTEHGEQLKHSFLVFSYGGKPHLLLKMSSRTQKNLQRLTEEALDEKKDLNDYVNRLLEQYLPDEPGEGEEEGDHAEL